MQPDQQPPQLPSWTLDESGAPAGPAASAQPNANQPTANQSTANQPHYLQAGSSSTAMDSKARRGQRRIIFGSLWLVGGVLVTLVTLSQGFGVVAWGAILYGVIQIVFGARDYQKNKLL